MAGLVVNVHVRALHVGQALQLDLQRLGHVVRVPQRFVRSHDDVDFYNDPRPAVIRANRVEGQDLGRVRHCYVGEASFSISGIIGAPWEIMHGQMGVQGKWNG